jgi:hypothetical protein
MNKLESVLRKGVDPKFPSINRYLNLPAISGVEFRANQAKFEAETTWPRLERFAKQGKFPLPTETYGDAVLDDLWYDVFNVHSSFDLLASDHFDIGAMEALGKSPSSLLTWNRAISYAFYAQAILFETSLINLGRFRAGDHDVLSTALIFVKSVPISARLITLGSETEGLDLAKSICEWSHVEVQSEIGTEQGMMGAYGDAGKSITHHFVMRLICDWQGWPVYRIPPCAFEEPLFNELVTNWRTNDLPMLAHLLLCACDYHTHEAKFGSSKKDTYPDHRRTDLFYDPFEIKLVLYLRSKLGLENPEIDHVLMKTALGAVPEPCPLFRNDLIDAVMAQVRKEYPNV